MNWNWEQLIRAIVPLTFLAIWALTSLFNRDSKAFPQRPAGGPMPLGPRPGEPTLRWTPPPPPQPRNPGARRVPLGDDDILILPPDPMRIRPGQARPAQPAAPRRNNRGKPQAPQPRKPEAPAARQKLSGVNQLVNQQLANPVGMTPLTTIAPMATSTGSDLASAPTSASRTTAPIPTISTLIPLMNDPARLREAFLVNELLKPPLALRRLRGTGR